MTVRATAYGLHHFQIIKALIEHRALYGNNYIYVTEIISAGFSFDGLLLLQHSHYRKIVPQSAPVET